MGNAPSYSNNNDITLEQAVEDLAFHLATGSANYYAPISSPQRQEAHPNKKHHHHHHSNNQPSEKAPTKTKHRHSNKISEQTHWLPEDGRQDLKLLNDCAPLYKSNFPKTRALSTMHILAARGAQPAQEDKPEQIVYNSDDEYSQKPFSFSKHKPATVPPMLRLTPPHYHPSEPMPRAFPDPEDPQNCSPKSADFHPAIADLFREEPHHVFDQEMNFQISHVNIGHAYFRTGPGFVSVTTPQRYKDKIATVVLYVATQTESAGLP